MSPADFTIPTSSSLKMDDESEVNIMAKCKNCGAEKGIHHYRTFQCPLNGKEVPFDKTQEYHDTIFEPGPSYIELLHQRDTLLEACKWASRGEHHPACKARKGHKCDCYVGACEVSVAQAEKGT